MRVYGSRRAVTLAVVLFVETGLVVRSVRALGAVGRGASAPAVSAGWPDRCPSTYTPARIVQFHDELRARLTAVPGIDAVGAMGDVFLRRFPDQKIIVEGRGPACSHLTAELVTPGVHRRARIDPAGRGCGAGGHVDERTGRLHRDRVVQSRQRLLAWRIRSGYGFWWSSPLISTWTDPRLRVVGVVSDFRRERLDAPAFPNVFVIIPMASVDLVIQDCRGPGRPYVGGSPSGGASGRQRATHGLAPAWNRFADHGLSVFPGVAARWITQRSPLASRAIGLFASSPRASCHVVERFDIRLALGAQPAAVGALALVMALS